MAANQINIKKVVFGNKEHTTDSKMGVSVLLRLFVTVMKFQTLLTKSAENNFSDVIILSFFFFVRLIRKFHKRLYQCHCIDTSAEVPFMY